MYRWVCTFSYPLHRSPSSHTPSTAFTPLPMHIQAHRTPSFSFFNSFFFHQLVLRRQWMRTRHANGLKLLRSDVAVRGVFIGEDNGGEKKTRQKPLPQRLDFYRARAAAGTRAMAVIPRGTDAEHKWGWKGGGRWACTCICAPTLSKIKPLGPQWRKNAMWKAGGGGRRESYGERERARAYCRTLARHHIRGRGIPIRFSTLSAAAIA